MKRFLSAMLLALCLTIGFDVKAHAEYAFSSGGYDYHFISGSDLNYSVSYGGNWDKVYPVIVGVYQNKVPRSSLLFVFAQKGGAWYYNIKDAGTDLAPVSSNSGAQTVFNLLQKEIARQHTVLDKQRKSDALRDTGIKYSDAKFYDVAIMFSFRYCQRLFESRRLQ